MIQMKQAFNTALNKHYRCPKGIMGRIAGEVMVRQLLEDALHLFW